MLLSLFSGCGGLDLGFEQAGFSTGLAYDIRPHSVLSWNRNRPKHPVARVTDIRTLSVAEMDADHGRQFSPKGVVGGPPCQSFTNANSSKRADDPRSELVARFFKIALDLHTRSPLDFIVMENVPELATERYKSTLAPQIAALEQSGFVCSQAILNAKNFGVAQSRRRLFLVALNKKVYGGRKWTEPTKLDTIIDVRKAIGGLPSPTFYSRGLEPSQIDYHANHWCMVPKSPKFGTALLLEGKSTGRSFKKLDWDRPSFTVSYGHREVHVHPDATRRLSVHEAMLLQGFPKKFTLEGSLSSQITQVSEAVPPPMARVIAESIKATATAGVPR
ncbi:DNA cytosine methyltransferase [Sphingomonas aerolata]|uniref:DNA cytosine methyltransferase n=1 Tax=Sphingomonas aerolata TaxID=185951 RepID=UPI003A5BBD49